MLTMQINIAQDNTVFSVLCTMIVHQSDNVCMNPKHIVVYIRTATTETGTLILTRYCNR